MCNTISVKKINLVVTPITNIDYNRNIIINNTLLDELNQYFNESVTIFNGKTSKVEVINFSKVNIDVDFIIKNDMMYKVINKF